MTHLPKIKPKWVVIDQDVLKSEAWLSLSGVAPQVYLLFLTKRRMEKMKRRGTKGHICTNSRELIFTYREAQTKYHISQPRFRRAIDQLVGRGFLDIAKPGKAVARIATEYALSERWRDYGTPTFQQSERERVKVGFCRTRKQKEE
jgi:hypothetical protein